MQDQLAKLLGESPIWRDFTRESDDEVAIVLRHARAEGDQSEDLILRYRTNGNAPLLVKLVFSRLDEEQANEGMYTMYCWASNCIHWIGENIGRADLVMTNRTDKDILEVVDANGQMLEHHVGTWMFWTD